MVENASDRDGDLPPASGSPLYPLLTKQPAILLVTVDQNDNTKVKEEEEEEAKSTWRSRYLGILLALLASLLFPLAGLIVKYLKDYHAFSLTFWRFQGILLPAVPMAVFHQFHKKEKIFGNVTARVVPFILLRCLTGCSAVIFQFYSLKYISLADSTVIGFSTPVWVALIAHFTLGEKCGVVPIFSGILAVIGVTIITRPPIITGEAAFDMDTLTGCLLSLGCMVCATGTFVVLRYLRQVHYAALNLVFGIWGTLETAVLALATFNFQIPSGETDWVLAVGLGSISFVTQLSMTLAFKFEQAATVSLIRCTDVIWTFLWQFAVFQIVPDRFSVLGAAVVLSGILLVGLRKWIMELPKGSGVRGRFEWVLK